MSPKLIDPTSAAVPPKTLSGLWLFAGMAVALILLASRTAWPQERVAFSIHAAEPQIVQSPTERVSFSIHASEDVTESPTRAATIAFSVHDAQPDCTPARRMNRMLVIHPATQTIKVKVCDENGCHFELRTVPPPILAELKKLSPKWSSGDKECDHFRLVNADDPKNADLIRELEIKRDDLPLLVKETDVEKRKKAAGMSDAEIAKLWNKWFVEPAAENETAESAQEKCLPTFASSGEQWTYPGNIRHHLTDPRFAHHLPAALVATWSDAQCLGWHNWHHQVLGGRKAITRQPAASQPAKPRPVSSTDRISNRTEAIARSVIRSPPPQMVAAASGDDSKAKKKPNANSANGNRMSGSA